MKKYEKPKLEEEIIELEDVCVTSGQGDGIYEEWDSKVGE